METNDDRILLFKSRFLEIPVPGVTYQLAESEY